MIRPFSVVESTVCCGRFTDLPLRKFFSLLSLSNQVRAVLLIMRRFEWTWVGLLFGNDEAGRDAARLLQADLDQSGLGCVAYAEALPFDNDLDKLQRIVTVMKTSTARVVIVFAYGSFMFNLMDEVCVMKHV